MDQEQEYRQSQINYQRSLFESAEALTVNELEKRIADFENRPKEPVGIVRRIINYFLSEERIVRDQYFVDLAVLNLRKKS